MPPAGSSCACVFCNPRRAARPPRTCQPRTLNLSTPVVPMHVRLLSGSPYDPSIKSLYFSAARSPACFVVRWWCRLGSAWRSTARGRLQPRPPTRASTEGLPPPHVRPPRGVGGSAGAVAWPSGARPGWHPPLAGGLERTPPLSHRPPSRRRRARPMPAVGSASAATRVRRRRPPPLRRAAATRPLCPPADRRGHARPLGAAPRGVFFPRRRGRDGAAPRAAVAAVVGSAAAPPSLPPPPRRGDARVGTLEATAPSQWEEPGVGGRCRTRAPPRCTTACAHGMAGHRRAWDCGATRRCPSRIARNSRRSRCGRDGHGDARGRRRCGRPAKGPVATRATGTSYGGTRQCSVERQTIVVSAMRCGPVRVGAAPPVPQHWHTREEERVPTVPRARHCRPAVLHGTRYRGGA